MATVAEIYARLEAEGSQPPWVSKLRRASLEDTGLFDPLNEKEYEVADQPTLKPTRKVSVGALSGALTVLAVYLVGLAGLVITPEVAAAVTVVISTLLAYVVPSADQDVE